MLFNSYIFILVFFPAVFGIYFILNKAHLTIASRIWLAVCSLFFYSWWNIAYLPLILLSIIFNYAIGLSISRQPKSSTTIRISLLITGLVCNLGLLIYFKYANFFISNVNQLFGSDLKSLHIVLPLGISFFTFTQIAYLVDAYAGLAKEYSFFNYILFVTYLPHLIAGPIIHHKEMMPQFESNRNKLLIPKNIRAGLFLFSMGLFKKLVLADTFAIWANYGFNQEGGLSLFEAWIVPLTYTFQLYFDFSGYTDMALGSSLFFNIKLPINFNSPYKALNIRDFWQRWHMTLSRFFMHYIYIPLGGNRKTTARTYLNLITTFIIGGIWHGAGWLFILWGVLHGLANVFYRLWEKLNIRLNPFIAWFITFNFVNLTWIFFRAKNLTIAKSMVYGMFDFSNVNWKVFNSVPIRFEEHWFEFGWNREGSPINSGTFALVVVGFIIVTCFRNSNELTAKINGSYGWAIATGLLFGIALLFMDRSSAFLYFQF